MTPDLPLELWMKILSFLPPGTTRNMLSVSSQLFKLSMADRYRKFDVVASDARTLERIQHVPSHFIFNGAEVSFWLREPMVTQHIKWMEINSSFLCAADADLQIMAAPPTPRSLRKKLSSFIFRSKSKRPWTNRPVEPANLVAALVANLSHCFQLEEVTFRLEDCLETNEFSSLLSNIWSQRGQFVRKLHIEATLPHLHYFLESSSTSLPHLELLSLKFLSSRISHPPPDSAALCQKIIAFIKCHDDTLDTFILPEPAFITFVDLSTLLQDLGFLPNLRRLKIPIVLHSPFQPQLDYLQESLALHAATLQHLDLCFRRVYFFMSDPLGTFHTLINTVLPTLQLPALLELAMDVYIGEKVRHPFRLPHFKTFAPNIKNLILRGAKGSLNISEFKTLLQNLSEVNLCSLYLQVEYLAPEHFDLLASKLPMLESLELIYMDLTITFGMQLSRRYDEISEFKFAATFDNRMYANWGLKYLRLARRSSCEAGHPRARVNEMIAISIPGLEVNDNGRRCDCP